ncbi:MAG TPA: sugar ABC transporter permease [Chloroflexota bacterium]|jgi:multiple sugar transport system permease protein|nr:sugar ABC transporter permease [Chloroflexota bacterium]
MARSRFFDNALPYLFALPVILFECVLVVYPILDGIATSLTFTELAGLPPRFVGLANYARLLRDPKMIDVAYATVVLTLGSVTAALLAGLFVAMLLQRPFRGQSVVRVLLMLPWAVPDLPALLTVSWMLNPVTGVMQVLFRLIPGVDQNVQIFNDPTLSRLALIGIAMWKAYPFYSLVFLAALHNIPDQLYEAARVDGANPYQQFRYVTLPFIAPTFLVLTVLALIFSIKGFSLSFLFTGGGPDLATETLVVHIYKTAFYFFDYSYGQTMGTAGLFVAAALAIAFQIIERRRAAEGY